MAGFVVPRPRVQSAIARIRHAFGLKPYKSETFKPSTDPFFVEKVRDVVGLYTSPPENAIVLSIDEKSQVHRRDAALFRAHQDELRFLLRRYHKAHVICDTAKCRTIHEMAVSLSEQQGRIEFHVLAKCSFDCNPIERVW